ncbi:cupin domain-containing protein [Spirosoma arcticum]
MKRRKFIEITLAAAPLAAASQPKPATGQPTPNPFSVKKGEGRYHGHIKQRGPNANILDVKVSGVDTGGNLAVFDLTTRTPKQGPPLHVHHQQDETFIVQEGEYALIVGGDKMRLMAGDTVFLPRNVPHAWAQVSEQARMTIILQPAGTFEACFVAMAKLKEPAKEEIVNLFEAHGMSIVGPPLTVD